MFSAGCVLPTTVALARAIGAPLGLILHRCSIHMARRPYGLHRLKANFMTVSAVQGFAKVLEPFLAPCDAEDLAKDWAALGPKALKRVDNILASTGLTMDSVMAHVSQARRHPNDRPHDWEVRRNGILREIDRHRETLRQDCVGWYSKSTIVSSA
jgi:hypothetical protein